MGCNRIHIMDIRIIDFDVERIKEASSLLKDTHRRSLEKYGDDIFLKDEQYEAILREELAKDVSRALMLLADDQLVGYMIAVIKTDPHRGKSGWVNLGGWAILPEYSSSLNLLYAGIAEDWVSRKILSHYCLVFHNDGEKFYLLQDLGFAKEQTHALLALKDYVTEPSDSSPSDLVLRKADENDGHHISGFSRIIAEYQATSPCFASAPDAYLKALDKGFGELPDDEEAEITLAIRGDVAVAIEIFFEEKPHLLSPRNSVELSVGAVKGECRGGGIGRQLTEYSFADQKAKGREYIVTDWRCANLLSSRFWPKTGFEPVAHRLVRRIDPYILEG